jgi:hypothetical protein
MNGPVQFSFANVEQAAPGAKVVQFGGGVENDLEDDDKPFVPAPKPKKAIKSPSKPINVLALAKARLKEVKAQLKEMKALEDERDELERLITAASKPLKK